MNVAFEAILHNPFVIGEAVKALPGEVVDQDPGIPRGEIGAMRDVIGHHYHRIVPAAPRVDHAATTVEMCGNWRITAAGHERFTK